MMVEEEGKTRLPERWDDRASNSDTASSETTKVDPPAAEFFQRFESTPPGKQRDQMLKNNSTAMRAMEALTYGRTLDARMQYYDFAGLTYGGKRDIFGVFGYQRLLRYRDYAARIKRNGIAKRINNAYPEATWRNPPLISDSDDGTERNTPFEKAWDELVYKYKLWSILERLDRLSGIGQYGILLFGTPGTMEQPINKKLKADQLLYISPYGEGSMVVREWDSDSKSERYGKPIIYKFTPPRIPSVSTNKGYPSATPIGVHYSRVIHISEGLLEGNVFGTPRLEAAWNYLDDLEKITGGSAELFWLRGNPGIQFDIDPAFGVLDAKDLDKQAQEYVHGFSRVLRTQGVKVTEVGNGRVADPMGAFAVCVQTISGTTGIPARIFLGNESGELASSEDKDNWNERCIERRAIFAEPFVLYPVIDYLVDNGFLPKPARRPSAEWPNLMAYSSEQQSQASLRESVAESNHANAKSKGGALLSDQEARKRFYGMGKNPDLDTQNAASIAAAQLAATARTKDGGGGADDGTSDGNAETTPGLETKKGKGKTAKNGNSATA